MKNKEVCDAFKWGDEAKTKNLFSETANYKKLVLYSFGYHFPLCVKLEDETLLFNSDGYSMTTATHKGDLARSLGFDNFKEMVLRDKPILFNTQELNAIIRDDKINSCADLTANNI